MLVIIIASKKKILCNNIQFVLVYIVSYMYSEKIYWIIKICLILYMYVNASLLISWNVF